MNIQNHDRGCTYFNIDQCYPEAELVGVSRQWRMMVLYVSTLVELILASCAYADDFNQLQQVDFHLNSQHQANIVVTLATSSIMFDLQRRGDHLYIELLNTRVDDSQISQRDTTNVATSVTQIQVLRQAEGVLLDVTVKGEFSYNYALHGNQLIITVMTPVVKSGEERFRERGAPISINFQDIPVRSVLQIIADYNQFNLVVSEAVSGRLTLRLDGVPWQQVLDTILQVQGLGKRIDGNVVFIAPLAELEQQAGYLDQQNVVLESAVIPIRFAKASEIARMIGEGSHFSLLSEQGAVSVDERTNTLLVREQSSALREIQQMIEMLDVPIKQVQIEARIVSVSEGNIDELGVRWGVSSVRGDMRVGGSIEHNVMQSGLAEISNASIDDVLNVNLGATSPSSSSLAFQVGRLSSNFLLDLELSALQRESKAEVISSPRLITTNKQAAYIEQGTEIPYLESTSSGATSVSFKKAVLSLEVVPQITPDNRLVLDLNVTQDRLGEVVKTGTGEAVAINTQRIGTQVLVNDGETVVLGGIYQHSINTTTDKVPLLGDLPWLGALFRHTYEQLGKSELLIFVTPRVVPERPIAYQ